MIYLVRAELPENRQSSITGAIPLKMLLEDATGLPCLIRWFADASLDEVRALSVKAIVIAGFGSDIQAIGETPFRRLSQLVRGTGVPIMGICGGHQVLGCIFGGDPWENYPMRPLRPGEPDVTDYQPGMFKEWGFCAVRKVGADPLFDGLPDDMVFSQSHYCEIKKLPPEFDIIAKNDNCRVQAMRHRTRPVWGTQFHWERATTHYPHGSTVMANFLRLADVAA
jgi:GMP synthase (glutamine-hydrolysing)